LGVARGGGGRGAGEPKSGLPGAALGLGWRFGVAHYLGFIEGGLTMRQEIGDRETGRQGDREMGKPGSRDQEPEIRRQGFKPRRQDARFEKQPF